MESLGGVATLLLLLLVGLGHALYRTHYFINTQRAWSSARSFCRQTYYDLSTLSGAELTQQNQLVPGNTPSYWVGLQRNPSNLSQLSWAGGAAASDLPWDGGQPDNDNTHDCGFVQTNNGKMHVDDCATPRAFFCMSEYQLVLEPRPSVWEEALDFCRLHYTDLAALTSADIMADAQNATAGATPAEVYVGLRFLAGQWFWVDGEALAYTAWPEGAEPQCPVSGQRCGLYNTSSGKWAAGDCEQERDFLCVYRLSPSGP